MKKGKVKTNISFSFETKKIPLSMIDTDVDITAFEKKDVKMRAAYIMLNGAPSFPVNEKADGRFHLLAAEKDFYAAKFSGVQECEARVYRFTEKNAA